METDKTKTDAAPAKVPEQYTGSEMNAIEKLELVSEAEAILFFKTVKDRLLDVNRWREISGIAMSDFLLTDEAGNPVQRTAIPRDHIRINIPGPGTQTGSGYDWVTIEDITLEAHHDVEILSMRARPAANPLTAAEDTAHFLTEEATSTFQVKRIGCTIYAEEHGRNEVPNTSTTNTLDNIRNTFVGWGAKMGLSYPQWKALVKGLLS